LLLEPRLCINKSFACITHVAFALVKLRQTRPARCVRDVRAPRSAEP
jgi:hypothetical protein